MTAHAEAVALRRAAGAARDPAVALLALTVLLQVAYPLAAAPGRDALSILTVLSASGAALWHAARTRGARAALALAGAGVAAWLVEVVGVATGRPFGEYAYASTLGPRLAGVPLLIAPAWTMLAWPAALAARRVVRGRVARVLVGAWGLAAWDLFLDPQMVAAGHWHWNHVTHHLPGVAAVPLSNWAGWLVVALPVSWALQLAVGTSGSVGPPADTRADLPPLLFYLWTWLSSSLALAAFLALPAAAAWGALGMGLLGVPLLRRLVHAARAARRTDAPLAVAA